MTVEVIEVPPLKVLGITRTGKYEIIPELLGQVFQHAMSKGAQFGGPPMFVCHERSGEEVKKANEDGTAEVEIAVPIAGDVEGSGEIRSYELPGGKMARLVHKGPYEKMELTYNQLWAWLCENDRKLTGNIREAYLNDPRTVGPDEILTEILAPIE
jgi:effector-binding domain-containing protein